MEDLYNPSASNPNICVVCNHAVTLEDAYCDGCYYPLKGTESEQQAFIAHRSNREIDLETHQRKIKQAGVYLMVIGGLTALMGLFPMMSSRISSSQQSEVMLTNLVLGVIYFSLGLWSRTKPMFSIIAGASLFFLVNLLNFLVSPVTIFSGIIFKVFIVIAFVKGITGLIEARKIERELEFQD